MSAQHHETVDTGWVSFREEQERKRLADAMRLVAFLKAPADVNRWREKRSAHVGEDNIVPFEVWRRNRLLELSAPRQQTGAIQRVSEPLPSASPYANEPVRPVRHIERAHLMRTTLHEGEDEMPAWARPGPEQHLNVVPSRPLVPTPRMVEYPGEKGSPYWKTPDWLTSGPAPQTTGALEALAALAAQKPDDHTVPALEAIRLKHEKKESE